jgi:hypothetical protein
MTPMELTISPILPSSFNDMTFSLRQDWTVFRVAGRRVVDINAQFIANRRNENGDHA